jgi:hypothetical protein
MKRKQILTTLPIDLVAALDAEATRLNEGKRRQDRHISRTTLIELAACALLDNPEADREYHVKTALGIWHEPPTGKAAVPVGQPTLEARQDSDTSQVADTLASIKLAMEMIRDGDALLAFSELDEALTRVNAAKERNNA